MLMMVNVRYTSPRIPPITIAVILRPKSAMDNNMPCHCLFMITVIQDTGVAIKFRNSQGEIMLAISPAITHSSPKTNPNMGGPKKNRIAKMGSPITKRLR